MRTPRVAATPAATAIPPAWAVGMLRGAVPASRAQMLEGVVKAYFAARSGGATHELVSALSPGVVFSEPAADTEDGFGRAALLATMHAAQERAACDYALVRPHQVYCM
jgi:hypothetical protein